MLHANELSDYVAYTDSDLRSMVQRRVDSVLDGMALADDVAQEVWISMHKKLLEDGSITTPRRFMNHLINTRLADTRRHWFGTKGQKKTETEEAVAYKTSVAPDNVEETVVTATTPQLTESDAIFDLLPDDCRDKIRELFRQRYVLQKKPAQIAAETDRTSGAVRIELFRAHKKIEEARAKAQRLVEHGPPKTGGLLSVLAVVEITRDTVLHLPPEKRLYIKATDHRISELYRQFEAVSTDDRALAYTARQLWSSIRDHIPRGQASCLWERYANERSLASLAVAGETTASTIGHLLMRGRLSAYAVYDCMLQAENLSPKTSVTDYFRYKLQ